MFETQDLVAVVSEKQDINHGSAEEEDSGVHRDREHQDQQANEDGVQDEEGAF